MLRFGESKGRAVKVERPEMIGDQKGHRGVSIGEVLNNLLRQGMKKKVHLY